MPRTIEDLRKAVSEQRRAIRASCTSFDSGEKWEARRLATAIINLFHDKGRTQSLLNQLGLKEDMLLLSTSQPNPPGNLIAWSPLLVMQWGAGVHYQPLLGQMPSRARFIQFDEWWNESVYEDGELKLTRSVLLRTIRDQDGGSHYDPDLSDEAYKLMKGGAGWYFQGENGAEYPMEDAELTTARQIAYEVEMSLDRIGLV
ncbi:hypothetical protein G9X67_14800 [Rhizobium sp. WYCCWR 11152]|uniref:hypothetical protein n=1 Tax=Rhizobium sp. WYCCWR 11152 TaxID=2692316 RepID=UPI00149160C6|nr:hypothetical protein [Rhizobium sp. WYCCWR 11152]NNU66544.1 hypothetical protein [Rhizobium sp. WYCCWR 11152]